MQYIVVNSALTTMRLGYDVAEAFGPFTSRADAEAFIAGLEVREHYVVLSMVSAD